uniref:peptidylprolyl isomerase n=1 Tax=Panagrellus redivivus TaxID=6233 RepID=A0A7E4VTW8_PANRE
MSAGEVIDISPNKDGKVVKTILKAGDDSGMPMTGDKVYCHYIGKLESGETFDSSVERGPFSFTLNKKQVIRGWDLAVSTMKKGEKISLKIAPEFAYGEAGSPPNIPSNATLIFEMELLKWEGEDISPDHDGTILKSIIVSGEEYNCPVENTNVTVHAVGSHNNKVFYDREVTFALGEGAEQQLPEGVDRALRRVTKGEKCSIQLNGSRFTYGTDAPKEFDLPVNAPLTFTLFLKDFEKAKASWELTDEEKVQEAERIRLRGNEFLKEGKLKLALNKYLSVVNLLEYSNPMDDKYKADFDKQLISGRLNSALVHLKLNQNGESAKQLEKVLEKDPKNVKALYRLAQAYEGRKDFNEAIAEYKKILEIEPENKAAQQQILVCKNALAELRAVEKKRYHKLFEKLQKEPENDSVKATNGNSNEGASTVAAADASDSNGATSAPISAA